MNPHDRDINPPPDERLIAVMWEAKKASRVARCVLWRHPMGFEVRVDVDGETRQTAAQRRRETAEEVAGDWQELFRGKGWTA